MEEGPYEIWMAGGTRVLDSLHAVARSHMMIEIFLFLL